MSCLTNIKKGIFSFLTAAVLLSICQTAAGAAQDEYSEYVGDYDGNQVVDLTDVINVLKRALTIPVDSEYGDGLFGDYDEDGNYSIEDARMVLKTALTIEPLKTVSQIEAEPFCTVLLDDNEWRNANSKCFNNKEDLLLWVEQKYYDDLLQNKVENMDSTLFASKDVLLVEWKSYADEPSQAAVCSISANSQRGVIYMEDNVSVLDGDNRCAVSIILVDRGALEGRNMLEKVIVKGGETAVVKEYLARYSSSEKVPEDRTVITSKDELEKYKEEVLTECVPKEYRQKAEEDYAELFNKDEAYFENNVLLLYRYYSEDDNIKRYLDIKDEESKLQVVLSNIRYFDVNGSLFSYGKGLYISAVTISKDKIKDRDLDFQAENKKVQLDQCVENQTTYLYYSVSEEEREKVFMYRENSGGFYTITNEEERQQTLDIIARDYGMKWEQSEYLDGVAQIKNADLSEKELVLCMIYCAWNGDPQEECPPYIYTKFDLNDMKQHANYYQSRVYMWKFQYEIDFMYVPYEKLGIEEPPSKTAENANTLMTVMEFPKGTIDGREIEGGISYDETYPFEFLYYNY